MISGGIPYALARADSGPSMSPITKADVAGNSIARPRSSAAINRMMNMPMVAACEAVRHTVETCAIGLGSLIASKKRRSFAAWRMSTRAAPFPAAG